MNNQLKLDFGDGDVIINSQIHSESMEITESLCSQAELKFGCCESTKFKITIANDGKSRVGKTFNVKMNDMSLGTFKVKSDKLSSDRRKRDIEAYDIMYDVLNTDVTDWYSEYPFITSLKEFRDSFFEYIGVTQEDIALPCDKFLLDRRISGSVSGQQIITAICEINGVFGHIEDGVFAYQSLSDEVDKTYDLSEYTLCEYENYSCKPITGVLVYDKNGYNIATLGTTDNAYFLEDNFLLYDLEEEELNTLLVPFYTAVQKIKSYVPMTHNCVGLLDVKVGNRINVKLKDGTVLNSYVFERELKGIQSLKDTIKANGQERYIRQNSRGNSISKLWGQTQALIQSAENNNIVFYTTENTKEVKLQDDTSTNILDIKCKAKEETIPVVMTTIEMDMDIDGYVEFQYLVDSVLKESKTKKGYYPKGRNIVTLVEWFEVEKNEQFRLELNGQTEYFESDDRAQNAKLSALLEFADSGTLPEISIDTTPPKVTIAKQGAKMVLFAQGLEAKAKWDGYLTFAEIINPFTISELTGISVNDVVDKGASVTSYGVDRQSVSDIVSVIEVGDVGIIIVDGVEWGDVQTHNWQSMKNLNWESYNA